MKLYGKNPVAERLNKNPRSIRTLYLQDDRRDLYPFFKKARQCGIPVVSATKSKLAKIARNLNTQGIIADVEDVAYALYQSLLEGAKERNETLLFLDNLNDPQNLGAVIRTAACLGGFSLVLPTRGSVAITESVLRVASGGDNHVPVTQVANMRRSLGTARDNGLWIAGAVTEGGTDITEVRFQFPLAIVVGSEQKGIREGIIKDLDALVTIPMAHPQLSLNVAHAAAVICYEIVRQKKARSHGK